MSICYDFQKWTMISLANVAISLTIGLIHFGLDDPKTCDEIDKQMHWDELEEGKNLKDALGVE